MMQFNVLILGVDGKARTGKWILFILPLITVLREGKHDDLATQSFESFTDIQTTTMKKGLEAVIFVGGVSLGQPATSIPIAAIVGLVCGFVCGFIIYEFASRSSKYILVPNWTRRLTLPLPSSHHFLDRYDQLPPSHRSGSFQQGCRCLPRECL